jgi:ankyrin repeat protein
LAKHYGKLLIFCYFTEIGGEVNVSNAKISLFFTFAGSVIRDITYLLPDKGTSVNFTKPNNHKILHSQISGEVLYLESTNNLIRKSAAISNTNRHGGTPLLKAAYEGKLETLRQLIETDAGINIRDANYNTGLYIVSVLGSVDIISLLLDKVISDNVTNRYIFVLNLDIFKLQML